MQDGLQDYRGHFDKLSKDKAQLEQRLSEAQELLDGGKWELAKSAALVQSFKLENEKLRSESEALVKRTEERLKSGQHALNSVEGFEREAFELRAQLGQAAAEVESLRRTCGKSASVNREVGAEVERLARHAEDVRTALERNKKLSEENSECRRKLKSLQE